LTRLVDDTHPVPANHFEQDEIADALIANTRCGAGERCRPCPAKRVGFNLGVLIDADNRRLHGGFAKV